MRRLAPAALTLALGLVATACAEEQGVGGGGGGGGGGQAASDTVTIAGQEATAHGSTSVAGSDQLDVAVGDFFFEPTVLEGEAGQALTVNLSNEGDAPHTFTVDELQVDQELQPGDSGTVDVTFPDSGALVFYCRFHADGGMLGGLSVGGDLNAAPGVSGGGDSETDSGDSGSGGGGYKY
jgi:plastocyanin